MKPSLEKMRADIRAAVETLQQSATVAMSSETDRLDPHEEEAASLMVKIAPAWLKVFPDPDPPEAEVAEMSAEPANG